MRERELCWEDGIRIFFRSVGIGHTSGTEKKEKKKMAALTCPRKERKTRIKRGAERVEKALVRRIFSSGEKKKNFEGGELPPPPKGRSFKKMGQYVQD